MPLDIVLPYENKEKKETSLWSQFLDNVLNTLRNKVTNEQTKEYAPITVIQPAKTEATYKKVEGTPVGPLDQTKPLSQYTEGEARKLFTSVFGDGIVTQAFLYLTHGSACAMLRTLATAKHEGGLNFAIRNADPNLKSKQQNYSTFQLSAKNLNQKLAESKVGFKKLMKNTPFASTDFETIYGKLDVRQQNLALWLGHIMSRQNPYQILEDLSNPRLSDQQVTNLISTRIQGGIEAIGKSVVKQTKVATARDYYTALRRHGYGPLEGTGVS